MTTTVQKRRIDVVCIVTPSRNVRPRLIQCVERQNRVAGPVSILRRHRVHEKNLKRLVTDPNMPSLVQSDGDDDMSQDSHIASVTPTVSFESPAIANTDSSDEIISSTDVSTRRIHFFNKVRVFRIPNRLDYPDDMRRCIWGSLKEIQTNARRNTIEFASDGWNWRAATEDHEFIQDAKSGYRIHPAHLQRKYKTGCT